MEEPYGSKLLPIHTRPRKWWNGWTPGPVECHQVLNGGQPGPLNSPDTLMATHGNSFFGGTWKRKCTNLSLEYCLFWRGKLGVEFCNIPEVMVQGSIRNKKKRGVSPLENLKASILSCQLVSSHFITILAWCDLITDGCHMVLLDLAIPRVCIRQGRPFSATAACSWSH